MLLGVLSCLVFVILVCLLVMVMFYWVVRTTPLCTCVFSFCIAGQDERRGTEAVDPALITAGLSELRANALATFEAVLQKSWEPQRIQEGWRWRIQTTLDIVALLNVARNSMLRAARDFGSQADPLVVWVCKADELLLQQVVSAYIEQETDLSSLNLSYP